MIVAEAKRSTGAAHVGPSVGRSARIMVADSGIGGQTGQKGKRKHKVSTSRETTSRPLRKRGPRRSPFPFRLR